jgi:hypothetical protein
MTEVGTYGGSKGHVTHGGGPGSIPGQSMWDLWWTQWHWDRFFTEYFGFPLSISCHPFSITWKNEKRKTDLLSLHLHHMVAQEALRLRCVRSICCGALHHKKRKVMGQQ